MRHINWKSMLVGVPTTFAGLYAVLALGSRYFPQAIPEGEAINTETERYLRLAASILVPLCCVLIVFFLGALLPGLLASGSQGMNGLLVAFVTMIVVLAYVTVPFVPLLLEPVTNEGDAYTRADNLDTLMWLLTVFACTLPPTLLAGFFGGRLGGRLRRVSNVR